MEENKKGINKIKINCHEEGKNERRNEGDDNDSDSD